MKGIINIVRYTSYFPFISMFFLVACSGGGSVNEPTTLAPIPILEPIDPASIKGNPKAIETYHTNSNNHGKLVDYVKKGYRKDINTFYYQAEDDKLYEFNSYTDPFQKSSGTKDLTVLSQQIAQPTVSGGKLFACCSRNSSYHDAFQLNSLYYGAWIADNNNDLFVGGVKADPSQLQREKNSVDTKPTGKATYYVVALRIKDQNPVLSNYRPVSRYLSSEERQKIFQVSKITVNFNTNKVGGTIVGNADFGADIQFKDVNLTGVDFSGSVTSDGYSGNVKGSLYGNGGSEIGGVASFEHHSELNSAFGGSLGKSLTNPRKQLLDTSKMLMDLEPLK